MSLFIKSAAAITLIALLGCSSAGLAAQGKCTNSQKKTPTKAHPAGTASGPAKRPVTVAPGLKAAAIPKIKQRGYVTNLCEENAMMLYLVNRQGGMGTFGDYQVAYLFDKPEGWYELQNVQLVWRDPAPSETIHLESVVLDSLTGKIMSLPGLTLDVLDSQGNVVESHELMLLWHPFADHYGMNYSVPPGTYTLHIYAPVPAMGRHDRQLGQRFTQPLDATFPNVVLDASRVPAG